MSETDITLWEVKAKSGLLKNDSIITSVMSTMRSAVYESVELSDGLSHHISEYGITTESYSQGQSGGKLEIDTDKLRESLENDPNAVIEMLFGSGDADEEEGIISKTYDIIVDGMKESINKAGTGDDIQTLRNVKSTILIDFVTKHSSISLLDQNVFDLDDDIYDMNADLARIEERYYSKFTAMEKALSEMNSQSAWLSSQLGGA